MIKRLYLLASLLAGLGLGSIAAQAKVPIPCTSEKIVKVADLPRTEAFAMPGGQHVDLGYLYQGCFSGQWIGYVGSSSRYMTWKDGMLPEVAATAGMKTLPAAPGFFWGLFNAPGAFFVEWIWVLVIGLPLLFKGFGALVRSNDGDGRAAAGPASPGPDVDAAPPQAVSAASAIAQRRPARLAEPTRASAMPRGAAPPFGRRG
jgi:hypothetical protein